MNIYKVKQLANGRTYDFSYPNNDYKNALLKIKINDKDAIVEVESISAPRVPKECNPMEIIEVLNKDKYEKLAIQKASNFDMTNLRVVKRLTELNVDNFSYAADNLKSDGEFIAKLIDDEEIINERFKNKYNFASTEREERILKQKYIYRLLKYISDKLKNDSQYAISLITKLKTGNFLQYFNDPVQNDSKVFLEALSLRYVNVKMVMAAVGNELKSDLQFWEKAITKKIQVFAYLPPEIKENIELANNVVSRYGGYLKYFGKTVRSNISIIEKAEQNTKSTNQDLAINSLYNKYVNLRPNMVLSYPNSCNICVNTHSRLETLMTNIYNILIIDKDIAEQLLIRDSKLHRWVLNYADLVSGQDLEDCLASSKNWQILKRNKNRIIITFETENITTDALTNYIKKLLNKYQHKADWYFLEQVIDINYDSYDFKYQDEGGYYINESLPEVYTHLFYDDGYIADEFIPDKISILDDAVYYYGDDLFNNLK